MPRVTHVKAAQKDNPVAKKGESYYWWKFNFGPKMYSRKSPKRSELTRSDFLSQMYDIEDDVIARFSDAGGVDALQEAVGDATEQLRILGEDQIEKRDNMPEGLQEGPTGDLLESRSDLCESMAEDLEQVDLDDYDGPDRDPEEMGKLKEDPPEALSTWLDDKISELQGVSYDGE